MAELFTVAALLPQHLQAAAETPAFANAAQQFLWFLGCLIGAALSIALVTAALTHFLKPGLVRLYRQRVVLAWVRQRLEGLDRAPYLPSWFWKSFRAHPATRPEELEVKIHLALGPDGTWREGWNAEDLKRGTGIEIGHGMPDALFMHMLQGQARLALSNPLAQRGLFAVLSANVPVEVRNLALAGQILALENPEVAEFIAKSDRVAAQEGRPGRLASALANADQVLAQAAENALDELQLALLAGGAFAYRMLSLVVAIAIACAVAALLGFFGIKMVLFASVGAFGGLLALLLSDGLTSLAGRFGQ